ncbi:MAG: hypothetical protein JST39_19365, partial [Bacteroidetes bacterium]|nr:hypothetical protein [Bacteroidota bacterium]
IGQKELRDFQPWVTFKFPPNCRITTLSRREYEMVIGGYLLYYDNIVRSGLTDHHLLVQWHSHDKGKPDDKTARVYDGVTLLLSPPALRKSRGRTEGTTAAIAGQTNDAAQSQHFESAATPGPDDPFSAVDPPTPPPPPPPSLDDTDPGP